VVQQLQRTINLAIFGVISIGSLVVALLNFLNPATLTATITDTAAMLISITLLIAYWRGWEPARYALILMSAALIAFAANDPALHSSLHLSALVVPVMALVMASPAWVIGSALLTYGGLTAVILTQGGSINPFTIVTIVILVIGMALSRYVVDSSLSHFRSTNAELSAERERTHAALALAEQRATEATQRNIEQEQLLELVSSLETPTIMLADGILLAPVVGALDSRRAENLTARLLQIASESRARMVVLDIGGVSVIDTGVARALRDTAQALRLLGCRVVLSGISSQAAITMTTLGITFEQLETVRGPQEVLEMVRGGAASPLAHPTPAAAAASAG
jgi:rsbT co-antagonist protein RsbR